MVYPSGIEQKDGCEQLKTLYNNSLKDKDGLAGQLQNLENERLALDSQKEFLSNLKLKYENISESSNAVILLDYLSDEKISGIILKVEDIQRAEVSDCGIFAQASYRARGVAKPISLDPQEIIDKIEKLKVEIAQIRDEINFVRAQHAAINGSPYLVTYWSRQISDSKLRDDLAVSEAKR